MGTRLLTLRFVLPVLVLVLCVGIVTFVIGSGRAFAPEGSGTSCASSAARAEFGSAGHQDAASDPFYVAWLHHWCAHVNLGPATSAEFKVSAHVTGQNFFRSASRLTWNKKSKTIGLVHYPTQALKVFAAHKVQPQWGTPLTMSWLSQFYSGHDWGPALEPTESLSGASEAAPGVPAGSRKPERR